MTNVITFSLPAAVCGPVGVADRNIIPDGRMTASTIYNDYFSPHYGRLNGQRGNKGWSPKTASDRTDYLQVDMGAVRYVCAVATQGSGSNSEWITSYKLHVSTDEATWKVYKEKNVEKVSKFTEHFDIYITTEIYLGLFHN